MNPIPAALVYPLPTINPMSLESIIGTVGVSYNNFASATWVAANRALFIPFSLQVPIVAKKLFVANATTGIPNDNIDVGIYSADGTRIVSAGSTAQSGTEIAQNFAIADTLIGPGVFYLAMVMSGSTGTIYRASNATLATLRRAGMLQMASAFPLPTTATFAAIGNAYIPMVGLRWGGTVL